MSGRLATGVLVAALIRRAHAAGGMAAVLARGDPDAGTLLLVLRERGPVAAIQESWTDLHGRLRLRPVAVPGDEPGLSDLVDRRRRNDPDLWAIELDVADAERFAAETIAVD